MKEERGGGVGELPFPPTFLHVSTQPFFYFSANSLYQIKFSIVLFLLFYLKNASSNQNNLLPRGKWGRWFINNLWSLLWPFILPCPFTLSVMVCCPSAFHISLKFSLTSLTALPTKQSSPRDLTSEYHYWQPGLDQCSVKSSLCSNSSSSHCRS